MSDVLNIQFHKSYKGFHLDVSALFPSGIVAVFGPSGSGKTTILNCIAGLASPDHGQIILGNNILFSSKQGLNLAPEKRRIGYIFQDSLLFPHLSIRDNIHYGYRLTPPKFRRINPSRLIDLLELHAFMDRRPDTLSTGQRQRVVLARALATSPKMLLLDEPLTSLHIGMRGRILRYLKAVDKELSIPMVYVSHSISEVLALSTKALMLDQGKQLGFDEPRKILADTGIMTSMDSEPLENLFDVEIIEHLPSSGISLAQLGETTLALPYLGGITERVVSISIRASDIILASERPSKISARNIISAQIDNIQHLAHKVLIRSVLSDGHQWLIEITPDALLNLGLVEKANIFMVIKSSSIMPLD